MSFQNRITLGLQQLEALPQEQKKQMLNAFIRNQVKFLDTADVVIEEMTSEQAIVSISNQPKVQNHIGTVHAAAMVLVAETATGMVLAMNMPDDKVQVAKSLNVQFVKKAKGNLKAIATLAPNQIQETRTLEKGEVKVTVKVVDDEGNEPLLVEIVWAWLPIQKSDSQEVTQFMQQEIRERLTQLTETTQPAWGKFKAQEMIEHLIMALKSSYTYEYDKNKTPKPEQLQAKKYMLEGNNPMPRNMKNPFFKETPPALQFDNLNEAKMQLLKELDDFYGYFEKSENKEKFFFHSAYGGLHFKEVEKANYIHIKHHFTQFGLM